MKSVRSYLTAEDGFALAVVMGAIALMTVIAFGGFYIADTALEEAQRITLENKAYQAASSGLEQEMSVFARNNLSLGRSPSGYYYNTWQPINSTERFNVSITDLGNDEYEMLSQGVSMRGEAVGASETVRVRFMSFNLWDMNISGGENSGMGSGAGFNGNGTIIGKVYCSGDFDWSGNGAIVDGPIFVRNGVFNKQSAGSSVGIAADPVDAYMDNNPVGQTNNMYTTLKGTAPKLDIPWPTADDMATWETRAISDAAYNVLGVDGTDMSVVAHPDAASREQYTVLEGDVTLGGAAFGKTGVTGEPMNPATSADVIAFDPATRTLYLNGVVYCDGTLTIDSSVDNYAGKGVLVGREGIIINGRLVPKSFADGVAGSYDVYAGEWLPRTSTTDCLALVSLGDVTHNIGSNTNMQGWVVGAIFTPGRFIAPQTGAKFRGSIISNGIDFQQPNCFLVTQSGMSGNLPPGMPPLNNMNARSDWIRR